MLETEKERHNGIVAASGILDWYHLSEFLNGPLSDTSNRPKDIRQVGSLKDLDNYLIRLVDANNGNNRMTDNRRAYPHLVELRKMVESKPESTSSACKLYLSACKLYIDAFTNPERLYELNTNDSSPGINGFNIPVTAFYDKFPTEKREIPDKAITKFDLARFERIAKRIYMLLYHREPNSDFDGGFSNYSCASTYNIPSNTGQSLSLFLYLMMLTLIIYF